MIKLNNLIICISLYIILHSTNVCGYKILMVCPPPAKSHHNLCKAVVDTLGERGHELTFISAYPTKNSKHREIGLPELVVNKDKNDIGFELGKMSKLESIRWINKWQETLVEMIFNNTGVKKLMNDKTEKFDLVIFEYFMNEFLLGYGVKFNCPTIALSPVSLMSWLATMTSNPLSIATVPNVFTTFSANMNLWERIINTGVALVQDFMKWSLMDPLQASLYKKYFPKEAERVPFEELQSRIAAVLVNSHPSVGVARPLLPNVVEIGGYHVGEPGPLPEDLQTILDTAKNGVIFFAMGSNLKSSQMDSKLKHIILTALGNLKETVLWKYEEDLPNKPSNVIIRSWLPQTSILAHPNVKLFISHGGLLSLTESTYFGVPLLIIPIFGDQHHNAKAVRDREQGVSITFEEMTMTSFKSTLEEALNNPKYRTKAKNIQKIFHDRPIKPRDLLVHQVELVIRSNGAPHLSPPKLPRHSELLLDVAAVILASVLLSNIVIFYVLYKCCCNAKRQKITMKKKRH